MPQLLLTILLILSPTIIHADDAVASKNLSGFSEVIRRELQKYWNAFVNNDFDTQLSYTHPLVFVLNGGKEEGREVVRQQMIKSTKQRGADMNGYGYHWAPIEIGQPTDIQEINGVIYALLPQTLKEESFDGWDVTVTYLLAVSEDQGKTWTFTNVHWLDEITFYKVFPDINGKIAVPLLTEGTFVPKEGQPQYGT